MNAPSNSSTPTPAKTQRPSRKVGLISAAAIVVVALVIGGLVSWLRHGNDTEPASLSDQTVVLVPEYGAVAGTAVRSGDTVTCDPGLATVPFRQGGTVSHNGTRYAANWDGSAMTITVTNADGNPLAAEPLKGVLVTDHDSKVKVAVLSAGERKAHTFLVSNEDWGNIRDISGCAVGM